MIGSIRSVAVAVLGLTLASCDAGAPEPPPVHADLDCADGEQGFNPPASVDISGPGAETADEALRENLDRAAAYRGGGDVISLSDVEYALTVDDRIVHVALAGQNADGDWHIIDIFYCGSPNGSDSGDGPPLTEEPSVSEAKIVAAAVDAFQPRFGFNVLDASVVIVDGYDPAAVAGELDRDIAVVGLVPDEGAYWRVVSVEMVDEHYEVDIESVEGANYFAGTLILVADGDGDVREVDPASLGVSVDTSVS